MENHIIDLSYVQEKIEMAKREEILKQHSYKIWQGKDSKWYTYLPDENKSRRLCKRTTEKDIVDLIIIFKIIKLNIKTIIRQRVTKADTSPNMSSSDGQYVSHAWVQAHTQMFLVYAHCFPVVCLFVCLFVSF